MSLFAGIDIGSRAAKVILMDDNTIISSAIIDTGPESVKTAYAAIGKALERVGLSLKDINYTVATGYGRVLVPFAKENVSEISCHARGINYYFPSVRTIVDMGGQDCKAINADAEGRVTNFIMNDKCAGGTGRFLEMIAEVLNMPLEKIGEAALESKTVIAFNTICAVFAKSEAIACLRQGATKSDILAGLHEAIGTRVLKLVRRISLEKDFSITGGIAKNRGMVATLTEKVGMEPLLCEDPQLVGALGAAVFARERYAGKESQEELKVHYGYNDASGDYFITVDTALCDGCGECVTACPSGVFTLGRENGSFPKAIVRSDLRKKLALVCPGYQACKVKVARNCLKVCAKKALSHTW